MTRTDIARLRALDEAHVIHPHRPVKHPETVIVERGAGCVIWDVEGREYLDATAGLAVTHVGHAHPALVAAAAEQLGFRPALELVGPLDSAVPNEVRADLLAVLREALSNVVRHAGATVVRVQVSVATGAVTVNVADNGRGVPADARRSGLNNLAARAERISGTFEVRPNTPQGTVVEWCAPL